MGRVMGYSGLLGISVARDEAEDTDQVLGLLWCQAVF